MTMSSTGHQKRWRGTRWGARLLPKEKVMITLWVDHGRWGGEDSQLEYCGGV